MKRSVALLLGGMCLVGSLRADPPPAPEAPALQLLEPLDRKIADIKDLTVDFEQEKFTPLLKKPLKSSGRVIVKGERTRWETNKPFPSTMLLDDRTIQVHDPRHRTLEIYAMDRRLSEAVASPLPSLCMLIERFEIQVLDHDEKLIALRMRPHEELLREHLDHVDVYIDAETGLVREAQWSDPAGERTVIRFTNPQLNSGVTDAQMQIQVPPGTRIIRRAAPPLPAPTEATER